MRTGPRYEKPLRPGSPALGPGSPVHHCEPPARHASISARRSGTLVGRSSFLAQLSGALARQPIMALWYSGPSLYTQALHSSPLARHSKHPGPALRPSGVALLRSCNPARRRSSPALWRSGPALWHSGSGTPTHRPALPQALEDKPKYKKPPPQRAPYGIGAGPKMRPFSGPKNGPQKAKVHSGPSPFVAPFWVQKTDAKKGSFSCGTCGSREWLSVFFNCQQVLLEPPAWTRQSQRATD